MSDEVGMKIEEIRKRARIHIKFTDHARIEMADDNIRVDDIHFILDRGEIIEEYPDDKPFPSCLIYGRVKNKHIHVVCALPEHIDILIVITMYVPDPSKWIGYKERKK